MRYSVGAFMAGAQFGTHTSDEARGLVTISLHRLPVYWLPRGTLPMARDSTSSTHIFPLVQMVRQTPLQTSLILEEIPCTVLADTENVHHQRLCLRSTP